MGRCAGTVEMPVSLLTATVVFAKAGMKSLTGLVSAILPSSSSDEDRRAGDRLRLRRDAEDRVVGHLAAGFLVAPAEGFLVDWLAIPQHQRHGASDPVVVDVLLKHAVNASQPVGGDPGGGMLGRGALNR